MTKILSAVLFAAWLFNAQAEVRHEFVCVDNQHNQLVYVNQFSPKISWKTPLPKGSRDLVLLDDKRVLVSHSDGAEIYSLKDGSSLSRFQGFSGVQSASLTPKGNILIGNPTGFTEIDLDGKTLRTVVSQGSTKPLRLARMLKNKNIVYCAGLEIHEIDPKGKVLWTHKSEEKTYLALEQNDGSFLSSMGKKVQVVRIARDGTETVVAGGKDKHPGAALAWSSGFAPLPNGNIIVANWRGHGFDKPSKHLFEFNADNEIIWSWDDSDVAGVTTIQVIR